MMKLRESNCIPYETIETVEEKLEELTSAFLELKITGANDSGNKSLDDETRASMWELLLDSLTSARVLMNVLERATRKEHKASIK